MRVMMYMLIVIKCVRLALKLVMISIICFAHHVIQSMEIILKEIIAMKNIVKIYFIEK